MRVNDFIVKDFCSGDESTIVSDVVSCWNKKQRPNVFVVEDDDGAILGIVTVYDLLKKIVPFYLQMDENLAEFASDKLLSKTEVREALELPVSELMSADVVTVRPGDSFLEAATKMMDGNFDYIPVVDGENKCVGIVSRNKLDDALIELAEKQSRS